MSLRLALNVKRFEGPYGGSNQFANNLEEYLTASGHDVFRELAPNLDLILVVAAKKDLGITAFDYDDINHYLSFNPNTIVVQRVNTCDEQRGENQGNNEAIINVGELADCNIFVSEFMMNFFQSKGISTNPADTVIRNGADRAIFNPQGRASWDPDDKLRIVTHHWSSNYLKGFDIYERIDHLLRYEPYRDLFEFTIIGNTPYGLKFENANAVGPVSGEELARKLKQQHIYVTAARYEAGPNHVVEGIQSGLPMLYFNTGALPEYCGSYGIEFDLANFEEKLLEMRERYDELNDAVLENPFSARETVSEYENVFTDLIQETGANQSSEPSLHHQIQFEARLKIKRFRDLAEQAYRYTTQSREKL